MAEFIRLLQELSEKRTLLDYLETPLRYLATATDKLSERAIGQALNEALPMLEENLMATLAEKWLEQGRQEGLTTGRTAGIQAGKSRVLLRQAMATAYQAG